MKQFEITSSRTVCEITDTKVSSEGLVGLEVGVEELPDAPLVFLGSHGIESCVGDVGFEPQFFRLAGRVEQSLPARNIDHDVRATLHQEDRSRAELSDPRFRVDVVNRNTCL